MFHTGFGIPLLGVVGIVVLAALMHLARGVGRLHAGYAKSMLVARVGSDPAETAESAAALAAH